MALLELADGALENTCSLDMLKVLILFIILSWKKLTLVSMLSFKE
jgi:hypothetical protein